MRCLACTRPSADGWCPACRRTVVPATPRLLPDGTVATALGAHQGSLRTLVHRLKYEGVPAVAKVLAPELAALVPPTTSMLVPVPRARWRRIGTGIDPAAALAAEVSRVTAVPMARALRPAWWWPRHAGRGRRRPPPPLQARGAVDSAALLVDDVITTGTTIAAAAAALGSVGDRPRRALAVTLAGTMSVGDERGRRGVRAEG